MCARLSQAAIILSAIIIFALLLPWSVSNGQALPPGETVVPPGANVVSFSQISYIFTGYNQFPSKTVNYSNTGIIKVDAMNLRKFIPLSRFDLYLHVYVYDDVPVVPRPGKWVVQNLPVPLNYSYSAPISYAFKLYDYNKDIQGNPDLLNGTDGTQIPMIDAMVIATIFPKSTGDFQRPPIFSLPSTYSTNSVNYNAIGINLDPNNEIKTPDKLNNSPTFISGGTTETVIQNEHPFLEACVFQCLPESVANSLQWLENAYYPQHSGYIPHNHLSNVQSSAPNPADPTLVGQLETKMNRKGIRNPVGPSGTNLRNGIVGLLDYLAENNITYTTGNIAVSSNIKNSIGMPSIISNIKTRGFDFILGTVDDFNLLANYVNGDLSDLIYEEVKDGSAVSIQYRHLINEMNYDPSNGHAVQIIGAGKVLGVPWIMYQSDHNQGVVGGSDQIDFSYLRSNSIYPHFYDLLNNESEATIFGVYIKSIRNCQTLCFRSAEYFLQNIHRLPDGLILVPGYNFGAPFSTHDIGAIRYYLSAKYGASQILVKEIVTLQLNMLSIDVHSTKVGPSLSSLYCHGITSNSWSLPVSGYIIDPSTNLHELLGYSIQAIKSNSVADIDILLDVYKKLNAQAPVNGCRR